MRTLKRKNIKAYKETWLQKHGMICPITKVQLEPSNSVLDHNHSTGHMRAVIDRNCNQFLGKLESNYKRFLGYRKEMPDLPTILRRIAGYLETDCTGYPLHPGWADLQVRKFSRMNKDAQSAMLVFRGITTIGKTSKDRTKQFKQYLYE